MYSSDMIVVVDGLTGGLGVAGGKGMVKLGVDHVLPHRQIAVVRAAFHPGNETAVVQVIPEFQQPGQSGPLHDDAVEAVVVLHDGQKVPGGNLQHLVQKAAHGGKVFRRELAVELPQGGHFQIGPQQVDLVGVLNGDLFDRAAHIAGILDQALLFQLAQCFPDGGGDAFPQRVKGEFAHDNVPL